MTEHARRFEDRWYGKIAGLWPVILTLVGLIVALIRNQDRLYRTAEIAEKTEERVSVLEKAVAVQTQMLSDIRDAVKDIQKRGH